MCSDDLQNVDLFSLQLLMDMAQIGIRDRTEGLEEGRAEHGLQKYFIIGSSCSNTSALHQSTQSPSGEGGKSIRRSQDTMQETILATFLTSLQQTDEIDQRGGDHFTQIIELAALSGEASLDIIRTTISQSLVRVDDSVRRQWTQLHDKNSTIVAMTLEQFIDRIIFSNKSDAIIESMPLIDEEKVNWVLSQTGGNPLYCLEFGKLLAQEYIRQCVTSCKASAVVQFVRIVDAQSSNQHADKRDLIMPLSTESGHSSSFMLHPSSSSSPSHTSRIEELIYCRIDSFPSLCQDVLKAAAVLSWSGCVTGFTVDLLFDLMTASNNQQLLSADQPLVVAVQPGIEPTAVITHSMIVNAVSLLMTADEFLIVVAIVPTSSSAPLSAQTPFDNSNNTGDAANTNSSSSSSATSSTSPFPL